MCITFTRDWEKTEEPITCYKLVKIGDKKGEFSSYFPVNGRVYQNEPSIPYGSPPWKGNGKVKTYKIGKTHSSSIKLTPGFYMFERQDEAENRLHSLCFIGNAIIEVVIPGLSDPAARW